MNTSLQAALTENLFYLIKLSEQGIQPEEAKIGLRDLQKQYPEIKLDLLWEKQEYDQYIHYDTLLNLPEQGTISLSFCSDRTIPWPLRGVHPSNEGDLVRVNNITLQIGQAIACLDFIWDEAKVVNHLVNMCLIQEELEKNPIEFQEADLQLAVNEFRKRRKLHSAEKTHAWLKQNGITLAQLEHMLSDEVQVMKLRDKITTHHVEQYFTEHQADFDTVSLVRFQLMDREMADRAYEQIKNGEVDFYEVAQSCLRFIKPAKNSSNPLFEVVQRRQMNPALQTSISITVEPDTVLPPILIDEYYAIVKIIDFSPAHLDEPTHKVIQQLLFDEWLAKKRQDAKIEWYWGKALQTSSKLDKIAK